MHTGRSEVDVVADEQAAVCALLKRSIDDVCDAFCCWCTKYQGSVAGHDGETESEGFHDCCFDLRLLIRRCAGEKMC